MPYDTESPRTLIEVMEKIVTPVNQSLIRHTEVMQTAIGLIQKLVEMSQQEPTRNTIVSEVRKGLDDLAKEYQSALDAHDKLCEKRGDNNNGDACKKTEDTVRQILERLRELLEKNRKEIEDKVEPIVALQAEFTDLKKFVKTAWIVTTSIIGAMGSLVALARLLQR